MKLEYEELLLLNEPEKDSSSSLKNSCEGEVEDIRNGFIPGSGCSKWEEEKLKESPYTEDLKDRPSDRETEENLKIEEASTEIVEDTDS